MFLVFDMYQQQTKKIPFELTAQESMYYSKSHINFSVHILSQYFVSLNYTYFLYIDMKLVLKAFN